MQKKQAKPAANTDVKKVGTGKVTNQIDFTPTIDDARRGFSEQVERGVVISFGRMNPPTIGHGKLVDAVTTIAKSRKHDVKIFLSHSEDKDKNPLSYQQKIKYATTAFGSVIEKSPARTIIEVMKSMQRQYQHIVLVVGSDRVKDFSKLLNQYNGREYNFKTIDVVSAGQRDPDGDAVSAMSASKMRAAAKAGDIKAFQSGLPQRLRGHATEMIKQIQRSSGMTEQVELEEGPLNFMQRRQKAMVMRRFRNKIKAAKKRMSRRIAGKDQLMKRARHHAVILLRQKVAGEKKGKSYDQLSVGERMQIDTRVNKRKALIDKIAKRILPQIRRDEMAKMKNKAEAAMKSTNESVTIPGTQGGVDVPRATTVTQPKKRYHNMLNPDGTVKIDLRFKQFRDQHRAVQEMTSPKDAMTDRMFNEMDKMYKRYKGNKSTETVAFDIKRQFHTPMSAREIAAAYRAREGIKEEVEQIDEQNDELRKTSKYKEDRIRQYALGKAHAKSGRRDLLGKDRSYDVGYSAGLRKKNKKVSEEVEQIDELSRETLKRGQAREAGRVVKRLKGIALAGKKMAEAVETMKDGRKYNTMYSVHGPGYGNHIKDENGNLKLFDSKEAAAKAGDKVYLHPKTGRKLYAIGKSSMRVHEGINVNKASMGDVIDDFQQSDAPQFKGKSKAKRRQMAIAAKLATEALSAADNRLRLIAKIKNSGVVKSGSMSKDKKDSTCK